MRINIKPGKYVLAVSGGVDSMALLNMLSNLPGVELVVAHFNHGIRPDSGEDEKLAAAAAGKLGLPYEVGYGHLGAGASEETARKARYEFLEEARAKHGAGAIITAHHQDDLIETAFINLLRGTGRRGLTAMASNPEILRPLLGYSKKEIKEYAETHGLKWREDPTNKSEDYLRNYIRDKIIPKLDEQAKEEIIKNINDTVKTNRLIDRELDELSMDVIKDDEIDRAKFSLLPAELGNELLVHWLRKLNARDFDRLTIRRANVAIRTAKRGTIHSVKQGLSLKIEQKTARFYR